MSFKGRLDDRTLVKSGDVLSSIAEAEAMHLVKEGTTIPTPCLKNVYSIDGICYIIMTYEESEPFQSYWEKASTEDRGKAIQQLKGYVEQLRSIKSDFIGGVDGSPCRDGIFSTYWDNDEPSYGPFDSEASFNEGIVQAFENRLPPDLHLHPSNMLVRKDGTVVLLDWGSAGFWPEYWEYYRCMSAIPLWHSWDREVEKFVPPCYIEHMVMSKVCSILTN
ncbi:hypothetical protein K440DRAFT_672752 [Wilcoxina mikolae CBS 423.85]|nr:hypothetical protein K440DRAFT_672752 [Wilcoxina mikolae CBS 423.85]